MKYLDCNGCNNATWIFRSCNQLSRSYRDYRKDVSFRTISCIHKDNKDKDNTIVDIYALLLGCTENYAFTKILCKLP